MYGVLEDQYTDGMSEKQALQVAAKALLASAQRDAAAADREQAVLRAHRRASNSSARWPWLSAEEWSRIAALSGAVLATGSTLADRRRPALTDALGADIGIISQG